MCNLNKAEEIIKNDPNGRDLTEENYQEVISLIYSEIRQLHETLVKSVDNAR